MNVYKLIIIVLCLFLVSCNQSLDVNERDPEEEAIRILAIEDKFDEARRKTNSSYASKPQDKERILSWIDEQEEEFFDRVQLLVQENSVKHEIRGEYLYISFRVENVSKYPVSYYEIAVDFYNDDEQIVNSDYTNGRNLKPGNMIDLEIMCKYKPDYKNYELYVRSIK